MKTFTILLPLLLAVVAVGVLLMPGAARAVGERLNDLLFGMLARTGGVLGMAEITSREAARLTNSNFRKLSAASAGDVRASVITSPAAAAWAQNDTCGNRDIIPAGSRILGALVSNAALGASVTLNVGLRAWTENGTGAAIDAAAVVSGLSVASAQTSLAVSGTYIASGVDQVTTVPSEPYFTLAGADPTDNAQVSVKVLYITA